MKMGHGTRCTAQGKTQVEEVSVYRAPFTVNLLEWKLKRIIKDRLRIKVR